MASPGEEDTITKSLLISIHLKDQYCTINHKDSGDFVNGMTLRILADAPKMLVMESTH